MELTFYFYENNLRPYPRNYSTLSGTKSTQYSKNEIFSKCPAIILIGIGVFKGPFCIRQRVRISILILNSLIVDFLLLAWHSNFYKLVPKDF